MRLTTKNLAIFTERRYLIGIQLVHARTSRVDLAGSQNVHVRPRLPA